MASPASPLPDNVEHACKVVYRSSGLGVYAVVVRFCTMPLEKIAMVANSSLVTAGSNQLGQAARIAFREGPLAPFKTVGSASIVAWFLQYSVMGFVFQTVDTTLSAALGTRRIPYGDELMRPSERGASSDGGDVAVFALKASIAPVVAGAIESCVSNRAETQRFWGLAKSAEIEAKLGWSALGRQCGPAFAANAARNAVMSTTSFVATPMLYKHFFPQERKSQSSLFWFGLGVNIFAGNVIAITQQSLWGRVLNYMEQGGGRPANYRAIVSEGYASEGLGAFFTPPKWFARVLMNAPIQGTVPWFYNDILPLGEPAAIRWCSSAWRAAGL